MCYRERSRVTIKTQPWREKYQWSVRWEIGSTQKIALLSDFFHFCNCNVFSGALTGLKVRSPGICLDSKALFKTWLPLKVPLTSGLSESAQYLTSGASFAEFRLVWVRLIPDSRYKFRWLPLVWVGPLNTWLPLIVPLTSGWSGSAVNVSVSSSSPYSS